MRDIVLVDIQLLCDQSENLDAGLINYTSADALLTSHALNLLMKYGI